MSALCGADCGNCMNKAACKGCSETCGKPFGGVCVAAEYIKVGGMESFETFKKQLIAEINALSVEGLPKIDNLFLLNGSFVNLEYPLPNGMKVGFLKPENIYLGNQVECVFADHSVAERCFGIVAGMDFILISTYGENGADPELVLYKKRL